ncbi:MAG: hypothetical protein WAM85_18125 [Terracidiphilus sp.]
MKTALMFAATVVALSSFPLISQQAGSSPQQQSNQPSAHAASPAPSTPVAPAADMRPVKGALVGKLDSETAKPGDSVIVKTETSVKTADGTLIPKGSKLVGHVTGVAAQGQGSQNSQVSIQFDRAEVKGGQTVPIQTVIKSVAPAESENAPSSADIPSAAPAGGGAPGAPAGGGMAGSSPRTGTAPSAPQGAGETPSTPAPSANAGTNAPSPGTVVARTGNIAIRTTSIPGVLIANNDNGQDPRMGKSSGILLGAKQDIDLSGGTKMELAIATTGAGTQ